MLTVQPNLNKLRNDVFKTIIGGLHSSKPLDKLANQIVDELSSSMILIDNPTDRSRFIRDVYGRLEGVHKLRRFNLEYESPENNKNVAHVVNEVLYRFRTRYSRYF
ncbi:MAG: hypothetical protein EP346_07630 [Bacteroidetes bacterium]|nr:MAG: hypothetical protein EP346_07630 [Bacteroidota bacterium]